MQARFAAHRNLLDRIIVQPRRQIEPLEQGRGDDRLVADRQVAENRQPVLRHRPVLHRAAHDHVLPAVAPIIGHRSGETVDPLGEKEEAAVAPPAYHLPGAGPPRIGIGEQEIGGEAGEDEGSGRNLPAPVALTPQGQIVIPVPPRLAAGRLRPVHLVLPIDIAVAAPGADLRTAVPRVPAPSVIGVRPLVFHYYTKFFRRNSKIVGIFYQKHGTNCRVDKISRSEARRFYTFVKNSGRQNYIKSTKNQYRQS